MKRINVNFEIFAKIGKLLAKRGLQEQAAKNWFFKLETYSRVGNADKLVADLIRLFNAYDVVDSEYLVELEKLLNAEKEMLGRALLNLMRGYYAQLNEVRRYG